MNDVIMFLEELGRNSAFRLDNIDFEAILDNKDFDSETRKAILEKDPNALKMLLNARAKIVCLIVPAKDDDDEGDDDGDGDNEEITINKMVVGIG